MQEYYQITRFGAFIGEILLIYKIYDVVKLGFNAKLKNYKKKKILIYFHFVFESSDNDNIDKICNFLRPLILKRFRNEG